MAVNRAPIFDAVRAMLDRAFTPQEVAALDRAIDAAEGRAQPQRGPGGLTDSAAFFSAVRAAFGGLTQSQVEGFQRLLQAYAVAGWPIAFAAYGLATGYWETNHTMQPVREAYWVQNAEAWRKANLRYYPWYGRGDVQLTWEANYKAADAALGLGGALVADPDLAMRPDISARIMVWGMENGAFTGKKLADYLPADGAAATEAFRAARQIINGHDRDDEIAAIARGMQGALSAGGWA
jgi:putative chitinase